MQEEKLINDFWKSNERSNFSKEATVLFFYLLHVWKRENKPEKFYVHPASLLCKVRGFSVKDVLAASRELQERNYVRFTAPEKDWCSGEYTLCVSKPGAEQVADVSAGGK